MAVLERLTVVRRRRQLAATSRSARFARSLMWERSFRLIRRRWWLLVGTFVVVLACVAPFAIVQTGREMSFMIGFAVATAFWVDVLAVLVFSGSIGSFSGLLAEMQTAEELRRLRRHGWRVVNRIVLKGDADIDHVAIGPPGVLVVETKYSENSWPVGTVGDAFMTNRLADAVDQVLRNARRVARHEEFKRAIGAAPVRPVIVVDSSEPDPEGAPGWVGDRPTIVRSRHLRAWLTSLDGDALDAEGIDRMWNELSIQAERRDRADYRRHGPPRPTLEQIGWRALEVLLGFFLVLYLAILPATEVFGDRGFVVTVPLVIALGFAARTIPRLRWFARGWLSGCAIVLVMLAAVAIRILLA